MFIMIPSKLSNSKDGVRSDSQGIVYLKLKTGEKKFLFISVPANKRRTKIELEGHHFAIPNEIVNLGKDCQHLVTS